ncbi:MAG TPA: HD domain-containing phosphohydrolase, partial [Burkholderiaceae bacterium]
MSVERIDHCEIELGQPLRWDLYGRAGELLLRKGYIVNGARQLADRELYVRRDTSVPGKSAQTAAEVPSVVRQLQAVLPELETLLQILCRTGGDLAAPLHALAERVRAAWLLQPDCALAWTAWHSDGASASVRHALHAGVVAADLAHAARLDTGMALQLIQAALAMDVGMLHYAQLLPFDDPYKPDPATMVRTHPQQSVQLLRRAGVLSPALLTAVMQHHEQRDGGGYPAGVRAPQLALGAAIVGVAARYCALLES